MKVLYVSATGMPGGAERSLLELVRALDRSRFDPVVAVPQDGPLGGWLRSAGAEVLPIPPLRPHRRAGPLGLAGMVARCSAVARRLVLEARRRGVDLLHSNTTVAHLAALPAATIARLPCIWHVRDLHRLPALEPALGRFTRAAVFVSSAVERRVRLTERTDLVKRMIPNAIDADAFARSACPGALRSELGMGADAPLVVMAAQMAPWKGHDVLIRAIGLLREQLPEVVAVVAGKDLFGEHSRYAESLRRLALGLGLEGTVRFLGYREDVATLISDSDVVAVPSNAEPFGRVALEAMAIGRPVVGTASGGLPEVVAANRTGLLVPPRDPAAFAEALHTVLASSSLRRDMGDVARWCVRAHFAAAQHARTIARLYEQILPRR